MEIPYLDQSAEQLLNELSEEECIAMVVRISAASNSAAAAMFRILRELQEAGANLSDSPCYRTLLGMSMRAWNTDKCQAGLTLVE